MYTIVGITPGSIVEFRDSKGAHEAFVQAVIADTLALLIMDCGRFTLQELSRCSLKKVKLGSRVYDLNGGLVCEG